jgi:hypothetical protein
MKILNPNDAFSSSQRRDLLDRCFPAIRRRARVVELMESGGAGVRRDLQPEFDQLNSQIRAAWDEYQRRLPIASMSRCPFTGTVWSHSIDHYGIDGFWWDVYQPIRRMDEPNGGGFYAFRGAMAAPAEGLVMPFLAEPGPEVPFVIGRLMQFPSIVAVISQIQVGGLDAYPIVYFTDKELPPDERTNDWGADSFFYRGEQGYYEERQYFDAEDEFLYDLTPWIDSKRVQWIAPGDESLKVQTGAVGCSYLQLQGKQSVWRCREGKVWRGPPGKA